MYEGVLSFVVHSQRKPEMMTVGEWLIKLWSGWSQTILQPVSVVRNPASQHEKDLLSEKAKQKTVQYTDFICKVTYREKYKNDRNCAMVKEDLGQFFWFLFFKLYDGVILIF